METAISERRPALTPDQEAQFLERGFVALKGCFSREVAEEWVRGGFARLGVDPNDPATWAQSRVHMAGARSSEVKEFAPKAWEAICAVMGGEERVAQPCTWSDNFIINFRDGADQPWQSPQERTEGWHVDGDWFQHYLDGPEQGLLVIVVWSDIQHQGGGTFIACDSVAPVARLLAAHPEGLGPYDFNVRDLIGQCRDRLEVTGEVGDVFLLHPFLLHTVSQNLSGRPRLITNPAISFKAPLDLNRRDPSDFSLVERAILRALGVERLGFRITGERRHLDPRQVHAEARARREQKERES